MYMWDVPCHVEFCYSFVRYETIFGSHVHWKLLPDFSPLKFSTIEPAFQFYEDVTCRTLSNPRQNDIFCPITTL
jgi:hypothetical protein